MKGNNSLLKDIFNVMASNFTVLFASILTGLVIPGILGPTNYGYYRMFTLYTTYTALLHFGFVDGLLLKDSGKSINDINKYKYRSNSIVYICFQFIIFLIFICCSFFIHNQNYSFLVITIGIGTFLINVMTYYQFISQITMQFDKLSIRNVIQSILTIIFTIFLYLFYKYKIILHVTYLLYIFIVLFIYLIMIIIYIFTYKDFTFGYHSSLLLNIKRMVNYCKIGIYLTIAYQVSNLITIIDNQLVSVCFKASTYGRYSFSYSMVGTAMTILSAVATVLLPHLKRDNIHHMINNYSKMISNMMIIVYFGLLAYFPFCVIIKEFLPEYLQSLIYLKIFLPELGITCPVLMITFNYYNALHKSRFYFYMSVVILVISFFIDVLCYIIFHTAFYVACGSLFSLFIWYACSEYFLVKWYKVKWLKNFIYMLIMILFFLLISLCDSLLFGFMSYLFVYIIITFILYNKLIKYIFERIRYFV